MHPDAFVRPWTQDSLDALLTPVPEALSGSVLVRMSARDYADLRMFGRDYLVFDWGRRHAGTSLIAWYGDIEIHVSRLEAVGQISAYSMCGELLALLKDSHPVQTFSEVHAMLPCPVCLAYLVMNS